MVNKEIEMKDKPVTIDSVEALEALPEGSVVQCTCGYKAMKHAPGFLTFGERVVSLAEYVEKHAPAEVQWSPGAALPSVSRGGVLVVQERARQVTDEGYTPEHDAERKLAEVRELCDSDGFEVWTREYGNVAVVNLDDLRALLDSEVTS